MQFRYYVELFSPLYFNPKKYQFFKFDNSIEDLILFQKGRIQGINFYSNIHSSLKIPDLANETQIQELEISPNKNYVIISRKENSIIEIFFRFNKPLKYEYQPKKMKKIGFTLLGIKWLDNLNFLLISNFRLEHMQVLTNKNGVKRIKSYNLGKIHGFTFSFENRIIILITGKNATTTNAFQFRPKQTIKLPIFELKYSRLKEPNETERNYCLEMNKNLMIVQIYRNLYCVQLIQEDKKVKIYLYQLNKESISTCSIETMIPRNKFALSVVDSLLLVHDMELKVTMIYDIRASDDDEAKITSPLSIKPFSINEKRLIDNKSKKSLKNNGKSEKKTVKNENNQNNQKIELYKDQWVHLPPNFVLDPVDGFVCIYKLDLYSIAVSITNQLSRVQFLLRRSNSKSILIKFIKTMIIENEKISLLSYLFDVINNIYNTVSYLENSKDTQTEKPVITIQNDMILSPKRKRKIKRSRSFEKKIENNKNQSTAPNIKRIGSVFVKGPKLPLEKLSKLKDLRNINKEKLVKKTKQNENRKQNQEIDLDINLDEINVFDEYEKDKNQKNQNQKNQKNQKKKNQNKKKRNGLPKTNPDGYVVLPQSDFYNNIFFPLFKRKAVEYEFLESVLTEYIRSLNELNIPVQVFLFSFLIEILLQQKKYSQIYHLVQYKVIPNTESLALQFAGVFSSYPQALCLALDGLKMRKESDLIIQILLSKRRVMQTLKFIHHEKLKNKLSLMTIQTILEFAYFAQDPLIFFTAWNFFQDQLKDNEDLWKDYQKKNELLIEKWNQK
ncbi:colon cancer-associated protein mic1 [Anaeramoeba ignava]|uniref:Colon cancer-associated protein mic1 n=1 Tax=Anaeramoeba ignava TaxID=1746090 RepID=A0A9Q0RGQ4_ANAIG|nr:colon cancer-associated protein mic1 [Anaeramoeba ignava]